MFLISKWHLDYLGTYWYFVEVKIVSDDKYWDHIGLHKLSEYMLAFLRKYSGSKSNAQRFWSYLFMLLFTVVSNQSIGKKVKSIYSNNTTFETN